MLPALVSTFSLAFFYFIGAIPAGIALGLSPIVVACVAWLSYTTGVIVMVLIGTPLRTRIIQRFNIQTTRNPEQLFWKMWDRFGLVGLAVLSPVLVGSQIGALIGLSLGIPARQLIVSMSLGVLLWCVLITGAIVLGLSVVG